MENKTDILRMYPEELEKMITAEPFGQPKYRAAQIMKWLHGGVSFGEMTNLSLSLRELLSEYCEILTPVIETKLVSELDGTIKYLYKLHDGNHVEAVFMRYEHGNTLCISSQVGCRMGCRFCASTKSGRIRNMYASEMLGEILAAQSDTNERVSNIVMMGIGEPLDNFDETLRFLRLVSNPDGLGIGLRHISVSTCGVVPKIYELAQLDLPITLSISLHAVSDRERSELMPINNSYNIDELMRACRHYFSSTGRRISFEYTLISHKNDSTAQAEALAALLHKYMRTDGKYQPVHVNLIPLNNVDGTKMTRSAAASVKLFAETLIKNNVNATVRRRLGSDINAACGQLRINAETAGANTESK